MTGTRRVVVGYDAQGRSAVVADGVPAVSVTRPNGATAHEIWRQESLPADPASPLGSEVSGTMLPMPPPRGISIRRFTLPTDDAAAVPRVSEQDLQRAFGAGNVGTSSSGRALARTASMYVAVVVSGRAYLVLESSEVLLEAGDCFVLPGALHAWRNPFAESAVMFATVYPLAEG